MSMLTRHSLSVSLTLIALISGCGTKEIEKLRSTNDSLQNELKSMHAVLVTMNEVKGMLDSIDASRRVLRMELNQGTTYENFTSRLQEINEYVKRSEERITELKKELKASRREASSYLLMIDALKGELEMSAEEIRRLESTVEEYQKENTGLIQTIKIQETQINDMQTKIAAKQQELMLLEAKVNNLVQNFKVSEAEAYFARAQAVEEAGNRTKLAPHKKKETYKEALELYKKAYNLGHKAAKSKITELEKKVK